MADKIHVRELVLPCRIGVTEEERAATQRLIVSLTLDLDLSDAGASDRLEDTLDYRLVEQRIEELATGSGYSLLERLAETIAAACLDFPRVLAVRVWVEKPGALRLAGSTAVEIERKQKGGKRQWTQNE